MADTKVYAGKEGIQELWRRIKTEIGKFTAFQKKPAAPDGTPDVPLADRKTNIIYLVEQDGATPPDMCKEWIWTLPEEGEGEWVCIGDTSVDLSKYVSTSPETFSAEEQAVARGNIGAASGDSLDAEVSRATAKEAELSGAISTETTRATDAETALGNRITAETTRAEGVETTLSGEIANRYTKTETDTALSAKQDKPSSSTAGDIATFDSGSSTVDSGKAFLNSTGTWDGTSDSLVPTAKSIQSKLDEKYTRPASGIPKTDMDSTVSASLGKADSALQGVKLAGAETPITPDAGNIVTIPTVNNATLTITQNGTSKGTFTSNSADDATIALTDTTYESKAASQGGSDVSLVTTGEKYVWNDWTSENVTINKYYPPDILYYTNFENMTGLTGNQATDVPIVGDTMLYNLNMNYPSRPTLSTLSYENTILPCLLVDYTTSRQSIIKANSSISTDGLDEFTTECILQFDNETGTHVYVALDGYLANGSLQIGSQKFFGKPLAVYIPGELQSSLSVYNGASKQEPDRIKIPVNDPYVAHKHQLYYNRALEYCEYYCDNVRYFKISKLPSWSVNLQLNIVSGGSGVPMKITQLALTSGRKTDLLYD